MVRKKFIGKSKIILGMFIILVILVAKVIINSPIVTLSVVNTNISKTKWIKDIEYLEDELPTLHKNLFFQMSKNEFHNELDNLKKSINSGDIANKDIPIKILSVISKIGDAHTRVINFPNGISYPIKTYWFKEGLFIIEADKEYKEILGYKIVKINNISIEEIEDKVNTLISHENKYILKVRNPEFINNYGILKYFNIVDDKAATFTLEDADGNRITRELSTKAKRDTELISIASNLKTIPLYMKKKDSSWYEYNDNDKTLYYQFNICAVNIPSKKDLDFISDKLEKGDVKKLIIDLRNNTGGTHIDGNALESMVSKWKEKDINNNLSVIVGRQTFSSGMLYAIGFDKLNNVNFYGEPIGGNPNSYGEIKKLILPNSKINMSYSTSYFSHSKYKSDSFIPNHIIELSIKDYLEGRDPILDEILAVKYN